MTFAFEVSRTDVDGIPVVWCHVPAELPFFAGLTFQVGRQDETLPQGGITHLVEHLAMPARAPAGLDANGSVGITTTSFWASGSRDAVLPFLADVTRRLGDLPVERLERERSILETEAADRPYGHVQGSLSLRYGVRGPGLIAYNELGLSWLGPAELEAWSQEWFCRDNCVVYLTGPPPDDFGFALPSGARRAHDPPQPLPTVRYPCVFTYGPVGSVAVAMVGRRSVALTIAFGILADRVRERLRYRHGITYDVGTWYEPLTGDLAHLTLWADCLPENTLTARNILLTELEELAHGGPTEAERADEEAAHRKSLSDPTDVPGLLAYSAARELDGSGFETAASIRAQRAATSGEHVAEALREAAETLLLVVPDDAAALGGRFSRYPAGPEVPLPGRRHRPRGLPLRRRRLPHKALVAGLWGITYVGADDVINVRFEDLVGAQAWPGGELTLWSVDGSRVTIVPDDWQDGASIVAEALRHVPEELLVTVPGDDVPADPDWLAAADAAERGDFERAAALAGEAAERDPDNAQLRCALASYLVESGRWSDGVAEAGLALQLDPELDVAHRIRARGLSALGRVTEAAEEARRALAANPSDVDTLADFAWLAADAGFSAEARRAAARAVELHPDAAPAWFAHGWSALLDADRRTAEEGLRRAVELAPEDAMWRNNLGWLLLSDGRPAEALAMFRKAVEAEPRHLFAVPNQARALRELGQVAEAERIHTEFLESRLARLEAAPESADAVGERARLLAELGRVDAAVEAAERAVALAPEQGELRASLAWLLLGARRWREASEQAREAARLAPEEPYALYAPAVVGGRTRQPELAAEAAASLRRVHPEFRLLPDVEGWADYAAGRFEEAAERFRRTLETQPLRCCSRAWLAAALHASGRADEAATHAELARRRCENGGRCASLDELAEREAG